MDVMYGEIYAHAVTQGYQSGTVFKIGGCEIINHYYGFTFIYGDPTEEELDLIYKKMPEFERFRIFSSDKGVIDHFRQYQDIKMFHRFFYEYPAEECRMPDIPEGLEIKEIDKALFEQICGKVVPKDFWESAQAFAEKGKGYCIMASDKPVAWAFSAAVSDKETDIGVECSEGYRGRGLATIAGSKMAEYILSIGKKPVWACISENTGSQKTAERIGFIKTGECEVIRRE